MKKSIIMAVVAVAIIGAAIYGFSGEALAGKCYDGANTPDDQALAKCIAEILLWLGWY